jgi:hypothetical protein
VVFGAGRLKRSLARVKPDLTVDTEVAPPWSSVAVGRWSMQALRRMLGDGPVGAGVVEAQGGQSA